MAWWDRYFATSERALLPVKDLVFDRTNPRYTPDKAPANASDEATIAYLDRTADLGELVESIAASGYIDIEPLIVMPRGADLVVLEGNRRLAALKVLSSPDLARRAGVKRPDVSQAVMNTLQEVTAYKVSSEEDARTLIGFKHINGPQTWDAYAKARYAADWLDKQQGLGTSALSLTDIAARMGDKHDTMYRIVSAAYVLDQAEKEEIFRVEDRAKKSFSFSHLYTALTYSEYRDFIGLPKADRSQDPPRDPVDKAFLPELGQLLRWLYGSKSENITPAIRTQAPDLANLKKVLGNPLAKRVMLEKSNLDEALKLTMEGSDRFELALVDGHSALRIAVQEVPGARADATTLKLADEIRRNSLFVARALQAMTVELEEDEDDRA